MMKYKFWLWEKPFAYFFFTFEQKTGLTKKRQTTLIGSILWSLSLWTVIGEFHDERDGHGRIFPPIDEKKYWPSLGFWLRYAYVNSKDNYNIDDVSMKFPEIFSPRHRIPRSVWGGQHKALPAWWDPPTSWRGGSPPHRSSPQLEDLLDELKWRTIRRWNTEEAEVLLTF